MKSETNTNSVAVIGAGITGLTAAYRLQQLGIPATVYEAGNRVGGVIQTFRHNGYLAESGPNSILETSPKITQLVNELGLASRRIYSDPHAQNRYLVRGERPMAMPASPGAFLKTPLFSWRAKSRLFVEPLIRRAAPDTEESVGEFVVRRLGGEFLNYAINPLVAGIYAGDPMRLSVKHAFPKLHALEQRYGSLLLGQVLGARERRRRQEVSKQSAKKFSFDAGLQVLTDTLHEKLHERVHLRAKAVALREEPGGWGVIVETPAGPMELRHTAVLLTAPAGALSNIEVASRAEVSLRPLGEIVYPPIASVVLGFRREDVAHPLDGFGMLIPAVEPFKILGTLFSSSLFPGRAPAGHVTLTSYIGGCRAPQLAGHRPDELIRLTVRDLKVLLGITGAPTFQHTTTFPHAIPQYEVGFGRFKTLMEQIERSAPGLFFAGHFRDGISLSDSILSGLGAADRLAQYLAQPGAPNRETAASHQTATT